MMEIPASPLDIGPKIIREASDVKTLLDQIEHSYVAAKRALNAPAIMVSHKYIQKCMDEMAERFEELKPLVGDAKAMELTVRAMEMADTKMEWEQTREEVLQ